MGNKEKFNCLRVMFEQLFGFDVFVRYTRFGDIVIETTSVNLIEVCLFLKNDKTCQFEQLIDVCGIDYSEYRKTNWDVSTVSDTGFSRGTSVVLRSTVFKEYQESIRFVMVYQLLSFSRNWRIYIKNTVCSKIFSTPSVTDIWSSANWYEREVFDLFGVIFTGHPFLYRILTDYNFDGYPLRKDFPLIGLKDLKYSDVLKKCVYVDVGIKQEILNAKVIR